VRRTPLTWSTALALYGGGDGGGGNEPSSNAPLVAVGRTGRLDLALGCGWRPEHAGWGCCVLQMQMNRARACVACIRASPTPRKRVNYIATCKRFPEPRGRRPSTVGTWDPWLKLAGASSVNCWLGSRLLRGVNPSAVLNTWQHPLLA
jgi:hypothetical protein